MEIESNIGKGRGKGRKGGGGKGRGKGEGTGRSRGKGWGKPVKKTVKSTGGEAVIVRYTDEHLTLTDGKGEYYYVSVGKVMKSERVSASQMNQIKGSRELRGLQTDSLKFADVSAASFTKETPMSIDDVFLYDKVRWARNEQSNCPNSYWVEEQEEEQETESPMSQSPPIDNFDLGNGMQLCRGKKKKASMSDDEDEDWKPGEDGSEDDEEEMETEPKQETVRLRVCTWNVNHLSNDSDRKQAKLDAITYLLQKTRPDVLVLHEINLFSEISDGASLKIKHEDKTTSTYLWHMGPLLYAAGNENVEKQGSQYEYYAMAYSDRLKLELTYAIVPHESCDEEVHEESYIDWTVSSKSTTLKAKLVPWIEHRPLVVRELTVRDCGASFAVGIVHTSPSFKVSKSAHEYVRAMDARYTRDDPEQDVPWMLAGDWYVKTDVKVFSQGVRATWDKTLEEWNAQLWNTEENTNFPHNGQGMPADYFVTDQNWSMTGAAEVVPRESREYTGFVASLGNGFATIMTDDLKTQYSVRADQFASVNDCRALTWDDHGALNVNDTVYFRLDKKQPTNITRYIGRRWEQEGLSDHAPVFGEFDLQYYK